VDRRDDHVEIKLTASPVAGHLDPLNRLLAVAGEEAIKQGVLVCRTKTERAMPNGHLAMPWNLFPDWLMRQLSA
jgi:hypothetical protein